MRILQVCEALGGGVITSVSQVCNILVSDKRVKLTLVYSASRDELPANWRSYFDDRIDFVHISMVRGFSPKTDIKALNAIRTIIKAKKPDIVHLHSSKAGFLGRLAAFGLVSKVYYSPRGFSFLQLDSHPFKRKVFFLLEVFAGLVSGTVVACSESEAAEARKVCRRVVVVDNAIDDSKIPVTEGLGSRVRIGTLGRISYQKNPKLFASIASHFEVNSDVEFVWVGGGDDKDRIELEASGVVVTGWLDREVAVKELSKLDIYLQTSLWEGMPLSVIEAGFSGIPSIVKRCVGNIDVISHGDNGYIFDKDNDAVKQIEGLLGDKEKLVNMGIKAKEIAHKRFSLSVLETNLKNLYEID